MGLGKAGPTPSGFLSLTELLTLICPALSPHGNWAKSLLFWLVPQGCGGVRSRGPLSRGLTSAWSARGDVRSWMSSTEVKAQKVDPNPGACQGEGGGQSIGRWAQGE